MARDEDQDQGERHAHESGVDQPHRPAAAAAPRMGTAGAVDVEARLRQLEEQQARQTRALQFLIEGRWTGEMPHAAAEIDALMGGSGTLQPVDFPKDDGQ